MGQRLWWLAGKWFGYCEGGRSKGLTGFDGKEAEDLMLEVSAVDTLLSVPQGHVTALYGQVGTGPSLAPFPFLSPQFQKFWCLPVSGGLVYRSKYRGTGQGQLFFLTDHII